jgi:hypothetical protein
MLSGSALRAAEPSDGRLTGYQPPLPYFSQSDPVFLYTLPSRPAYILPLAVLPAKPVFPAAVTPPAAALPFDVSTATTLPPGPE